MFGFACDETPELMPAPISLSHQLAHRLTEVRKDGTLPWLRPDGKTQVTVAYDEQNHVDWCPAIVVSTQHAPEIELKDLREAVVDTVIRPVLPENYIRPGDQALCESHRTLCGGRPLRRYRSDRPQDHRRYLWRRAPPTAAAASLARTPPRWTAPQPIWRGHVAKNIVAAGLARRCQIELAYAIGVAHPVSVLVDTQGTGVLPDEQLSEIVNRTFDLRPASIISYLDLRRPIYEQTAAYGHFGRPELDLPWERLNRVDELKEYLH